MARQRQGPYFEEGEKLRLVAANIGVTAAEMERRTGIRADRFRELTQGHMSVPADAQRLGLWLGELKTRAEDIFGPTYLELYRRLLAQDEAEAGSAPAPPVGSFKAALMRTAHPEKRPLAELVNRRMAELDLRPAQVGAAIGEHPLQAKQIMEGHRFPIPAQIRPLAELLQVPVAAIDAAMKAGLDAVAAAGLEEQDAPEEPVVLAEPVGTEDPFVAIGPEDRAEDSGEAEENGVEEPVAAGAEPKGRDRNGARGHRRPGRPSTRSRIPDPVAEFTQERDSRADLGEKVALPEAQLAAHRLWDLLMNLQPGCPEIERLLPDAYELYIALAQGEEARRLAGMVEAVNEAWRRVWRIEQGLELLRARLLPGTMFFLERETGAIRTVVEAAQPEGLESPGMEALFVRR